MKLLRTIRFDDSDDQVYARAAVPGEWAVSGTFAFAGADPAALKGKAKQAFSNGFLGVTSFGRSTFASCAEASDEDMRHIEEQLADHFVAHYGAPGREAALPAAREEIAFVADLCAEALINTVFTLRRYVDEAGQIREEFRTIKAPSDEPLHTKIWTVVEDDA